MPTVFNCPNCGIPVPNKQNLTGTGIPVEHDIGYCLGCNNYLMFRNDQKYRVFRKDEWELFKSLNPLPASYISDRVKLLKGEPIVPPGKIRNTRTRKKVVDK